MTREQAKAAWIPIADELDDIFRKRRPKMKSFEVQHSFAAARTAVLAAYRTAADAKTLRDIAFKACGEA